MNDTTPTPEQQQRAELAMVMAGELVRLCRYSHCTTESLTEQLKVKLEPLLSSQDECERLRNEMLVLEKCVKKCLTVSIVECEGQWVVAEKSGEEKSDAEGEGKTLPLAIARFAKCLYSK